MLRNRYYARTLNCIRTRQRLRRRERMQRMPNRAVEADVSESDSGAPPPSRYAFVVTDPAAVNPIACPAFINPHEAGEKRRFDCRFYETCLDLAVEAKWDSFTCQQCKAYDPESRLEMIRKSRGLLAIFESDLE